MKFVCVKYMDTSMDFRINDTDSPEQVAGYVSAKLNTPISVDSLRFYEIGNPSPKSKRPAETSSIAASSTHTSDSKEAAYALPPFHETAKFDSHAITGSTAVILLVVSQFNERSKLLNYDSSYGSYVGIQTNDAPVTYLIDRAIEDGADKIRVFAITSHAVLTKPCPNDDCTGTMLSRFESLIKTYTNDRAELVVIPYDWEQQGDNITALDQTNTALISGRIFDSLRKEIECTPNANIYIDYTGGLRDTSFLMTAITTYLECFQTTCRKIVYSNFSNTHTRKIVELDYIYRLYQLIDGTTEFLNYGQVRALQGAFPETGAAARLFSALQAFSDDLSLCNIMSIDSQLKEIQNALIDVENEQSTTDVEASLLRDLVPVIRKRLNLDNLIEADGINYPLLIEWCRENHMYQQALTLYTEKIPVYYFSHNIIPDGYVPDELYSGGGLGHSDEVGRFYTGLYAKSWFKLNDSAIRFKKEMAGIKRKTTKDDPYYKNSEINSLKQIHRYAWSRVNELLDTINAGQYPTIYGKEPWESRGGTLPPSAFSKVLNADDDLLAHYILWDNQKEYSEFYQINAESKESTTYRKKIRSIRALDLCKAKNAPAATVTTVRSMLVWYLAVKLLRNKMCHASEEENTIDEDAAITELNETWLPKITERTDFKVARDVDHIDSLLKAAYEFNLSIKPGMIRMK